MRIALDFDGVVHSYRQGFTGATDLPGAPVEGAREWIQAAIQAGHEVVIYSCRARTPAQAAEADAVSFEWDSGGEDAMRAWLAKHEFPELRLTGTKPAASVYIDDRALTFRGVWPRLSKLEKFRPWEQANALSGLMGVRHHPQEILTPLKITDCVREIFGGVIRLDPCAARDERETVQASVRWYGPEHDSRDGLAHVWFDYTFANPPYGDLKGWLAKALTEAACGRRCIVLCPVRSRRSWWRSARDLAHQIGAFVELNDLAFVGYESNFPESLCLMVFNVAAARVKASVDSRGIGAVL